MQMRNRGRLNIKVRMSQEKITASKLSPIKATLREFQGTKDTLGKNVGILTKQRSVTISAKETFYTVSYSQTTQELITL